MNSTDGRAGRLTDGRADGREGGRTGGRTDGLEGGRTGGRADGRTNGWMDGCLNNCILFYRDQFVNISLYFSCVWDSDYCIGNNNVSEIIKCKSNETMHLVNLCRNK